MIRFLTRSLGFLARITSISFFQRACCFCDPFGGLSCLYTHLVYFPESEVTKRIVHDLNRPLCPFNRWTFINYFADYRHLYEGYEDFRSSCISLCFRYADSFESCKFADAFAYWDRLFSDRVSHSVTDTTGPIGSQEDKIFILMPGVKANLDNIDQFSSLVTVSKRFVNAFSARFKSCVLTVNSHKLNDPSFFDDLSRCSVMMTHTNFERFVKLGVSLPSVVVFKDSTSNTGCPLNYMLLLILKSVNFKLVNAVFVTGADLYLEPEPYGDKDYDSDHVLSKDFAIVRSWLSHDVFGFIESLADIALKHPNLTLDGYLKDIVSAGNPALRFCELASLRFECSS